MAAAVRVALASEPCPRVSLKDALDVDTPNNAHEITQNVPGVVTEVDQNVSGEGNMDAVAMDVHGVTDSVDNVVTAVGGPEVDDEHVQQETDVYNMEDDTVKTAAPAKLADREEKVCSVTLFSAVLATWRSV